jgi:hypothetical protein
MNGILKKKSSENNKKKTPSKQPNPKCGSHWIFMVDCHR